MQDEVLQAEEALQTKRDEVCKLEREYWDARQKFERIREKVEHSPPA